MSGPRSVPRPRLPNAFTGAENADGLNTDAPPEPAKFDPFRFASTVLPGQAHEIGSAVIVSGVPVLHVNTPFHCQPPRIVAAMLLPCRRNGSSHRWLIVSTCCRS